MQEIDQASARPLQPGRICQHPTAKQQGLDWVVRLRHSLRHRWLQPLPRYAAPEIQHCVLVQQVPTTFQCPSPMLLVKRASLGRGLPLCYSFCAYPRQYGVAMVHGEHWKRWNSWPGNLPSKQCYVTLAVLEVRHRHRRLARTKESGRPALSRNKQIDRCKDGVH